MKPLLAALLLILLVITISGCTTAPTGDGVDTGITTTTGEIREFNMIAKQFEFVPNTITVNKGDTVKLHIESIDVTHGFSLPDFGINENLAPGKTVDVKFVADKTGTFTFACSVYCGAGHANMKGTLIVQ